MTSAFCRCLAILILPFTACRFSTPFLRSKTTVPYVACIALGQILPGPLESPKQLLGVGYSEIWETHYNGIVVCAKVLRIQGGIQGSKVPAKACPQVTRELMVWSRLEHQYILPLLGVYAPSADSLVLFSPFQPAGNASDYLRTHPNVDRVSLVSQIVEGISYIHGRDIIHGDLKGTNVLISCNGVQITPLICDFGVSRMLDVPGFTADLRGTTPWMAPELIQSRVGSRALSAGSDIWAWAMTVYELFTDSIPFHNIRGSGFALQCHIVEGGRPSYPGSPASERGLTPEFWCLLLSCWVEDSSNRPSAESVAKCISEFRSSSM